MYKEETREKLHKHSQLWMALYLIAVALKQNGIVPFLGKGDNSIKTLIFDATTLPFATPISHTQFPIQKVN